MLGCHTCFIVQNCIPPSVSPPPYGNMAPSLPSIVKRGLNEMKRKSFFFILLIEKKTHVPLIFMRSTGPKIRNNVKFSYI